MQDAGDKAGSDDAELKGRLDRWTTVKGVASLGAVVFLLLLAVDYFEPAELQLDLNRPRFRLVRHRLILPDQEYELEWKHVRDWAWPPSELRPIFGQNTRGGRYAWENSQTGSRFEAIYGEFMSDEAMRTNVFVFQLNTRELFKSHGYWPSAEQWATNH